MARITREHLTMAGPVLVNLGRELNEITRRIGPRQAGIALAGEQTMQRMTKLVKQGDDIIPR